MINREQNLRNLLDELAPWITSKTAIPLDQNISGISADSKKCKERFLFVALAGATPSSRDGHDFIDEAIKNGATAVVTRADYCFNHPTLSIIKTRDTRLFLSYLAEAFYDFPSKKLKVIGITGTNGKSSTTFMLCSILKAASFRPKIIGTLGMGDPCALTPLSHTTMDPIFLSEQFYEMANSDVTHVIMEVSSHALSLKRVDALSFRAVALTNITQDHLDFHETLENYKNAKARLFFELANKNTNVILPTTHSFEKINELQVRDVNFFDPREKLPIELPFFGDFHQENANLAKKIALCLSIDEHSIKEGLRQCPSIPGRLETVKHQKDFTVVIDFAHTPHALEMLLLSAKKLTYGRIILVFGCGGDRDQKKRPLMGAIAASLADLIIITDDNPRNEDPAVIRRHIQDSVTNHQHLYEIPKRDQAIDFAIKNAQKNDVVVIAGKGHENYQIYQDHHYYFSDQEVAQKILDSL